MVDVTCFHTNPSQCYLCLNVQCMCVCVCVFCLFTPFLSVSFVFHRKNLVLQHLVGQNLTRGEGRQYWGVSIKQEGLGQFCQLCLFQRLKHGRKKDYKISLIYFLVIVHFQCLFLKLKKLKVLWHWVNSLSFPNFSLFLI